MSKLFKLGFAFQVIAWTCLSAWAQLPECPLRPNPGSIVQDALSLNSQNAALTLGLTLRNAADPFGFMHYCFDYATSNGMIEAPTLRLNPGDTLTLNLTDSLNVTNAPTADGPYSAAHMKQMMGHMQSRSSTNPCQSTLVNFNTTNMHFHGLNIPPVCHQDDVIHTLIQTGQTFQYQIQIPTNEPPGLYWYHPHPHGVTALQVNGGAAGALIVGGIEKVKPQVLGLTERVLVIRQQFLNPLAWIPGPYQLTLNFQPATYPSNAAPIIQMGAGEKQFWRVANASTQEFLSLQVLFGTTPQTLEVIGLDGVPVTGDPMVTSIDVPPAGRAEFIVTGPPSGTTNATFVTSGFNTGPVGNANPFQVLANIVPTTTTNVPQQAKVVPAPPAQRETQRFSGLAAMKPTATRKLYFSEAALGTGPPVNFFITVDGQQPKIFTMNEPPAIVTNVGAVEDWTIENRTSEEHAFHIHQIHFLVMAVNGVAVPNPTLQDTYQVPYWDGKGPYPSVTLRMDFRDPNIAGTFVYHCHILDHEDAGMMAKIQVNP
ncbi:MAG TPA: multicopper oxidase domain-containing protein [Verrucomicrobiae bacterium]|jgi:FtsP/CotA-like multicopper oxidase with cupredoxin domain|nr:multicopper oxidase domain-containing protein [Verrucomicrobiae bacterium]